MPEIYSAIPASPPEADEDSSRSSCNNRICHCLKIILVSAGVILVLAMTTVIALVYATSSSQPFSSPSPSLSNDNKVTGDIVPSSSSSLLRSSTQLDSVAPVITIEEHHHEQHFLPEKGVHIQHSTISSVSKSTPDSPISMTSSSIVEFVTMKKIDGEKTNDVDYGMNGLRGFRSASFTITSTSRSSSSGMNPALGSEAHQFNNNDIEGYNDEKEKMTLMNPTPVIFAVVEKEMPAKNDVLEDEDEEYDDSSKNDKKEESNEMGTKVEDFLESTKDSTFYGQDEYDDFVDHDNADELVKPQIM